MQEEEDGNGKEKEEEEGENRRREVKEMNRMAGKNKEGKWREK